MIQPVKVRDVSASFKGTAFLWKVGNHFVITSAVSLSFGGDETFVFEANEEGEVTNWRELDGSFAGDLDHERAIYGYVGSLTNENKQHWDIGDLERP